MSGRAGQEWIAAIRADAARRELRSPLGQTKMQPRMSEREIALFLSFIRNCDNYVEFGTGGSTVVASKHVTNSIVSIDSSQEWLDRVQRACSSSPVKPNLVYVDIGRTGQWGFPTDGSTRARWPHYHSDVWKLQHSTHADLYLIDGRFRVASFAQTVLHCKPNAIIGIHDFSSRPAYHCLREIAREIATADDISFFIPLSEKEKAESILQLFSADPF